MSDMTSDGRSDDRKGEDQNKYEFSVKSENNSGQQAFGNHNNIESTSIQLNYSSYVQHNYNKYIVLYVLPLSETSSDFDSKSDTRSKEISRKRPKKKRRGDRTRNGEITEDTCTKQAKEDTEVSVFKQSQSTVSEEVNDIKTETETCQQKIRADRNRNGEITEDTWIKQAKEDTEVSVFEQRQSTATEEVNDIETETESQQKDALNFPQQANLGGQVLEDSGTTLRERKTRAKSADISRKSNKNQQARKETFFSPVFTAVVQLFCYAFSVCIAFHMEWPLWLLPYICYVIFISLNITSCIGCIKWKYIYSNNNNTHDDIEASAWMGIGIKHESLLFRLLGLLFAVSLAFFSSMMFGCTECTLIQTALLFMASTFPYLYFEKDIVMPKGLQGHCKVFRELNSGMSRDTSE